MSASSASAREVVISGLGVVSPIGIGIEPFWNSLAAGKSGVARSDFFPGVASPDFVGGEVKDFTDEAARKIYLKELRKSLKAMCREIQLGVASAMLSLKHAELNLDAVDHERLGIEFGANLMLAHRTFWPPRPISAAVRVTRSRSTSRTGGRRASPGWSRCGCCDTCRTCRRVTLASPPTPAGRPTH